MPLAEKEIEEEVLSWRAPERPFMRRTRDFYVTLISMATLLGVLLFIIEGIMPVLLVAALVFLFWVLSTYEPHEIDYSITTFGIKIAGKRTDWDRMGRFWVTQRLNAKLLVIELYTMPGRLELVITDELEPKIVTALSEYLVNEEVAPGAFDKAAHWVSRRLPQK